MPVAADHATGLGSRSPRVRAARQLTKRALRQRARAFLVEGPQAVREALASGSRLTELFVTGAGATRCGTLIEQARDRGAAVHQVGDGVMAELAQTVTPQGLLGVCDFIDVPLDGFLAGGPRRLAVLLAHVRDPGNAGTVLRTADAAGADGVLFSTASVDPYNGKCVRATAGSLFHLPVVTGASPAEAVAALRAAGLRVLAADGGGRSLDEAAAAGDLDGPTAWLFGNEAWGLPADLLALADEAIAVPIYGQAESLNLAAAAAVCLYRSAQVQRARVPAPVSR